MIELLETMGRLGIRTWCYEWMTDFDWLPDQHRDPVPGRVAGHRVRPALLADAPPTDGGPVKRRRAMELPSVFFLRVVPVAERCGVQLRHAP